MSNKHVCHSKGHNKCIFRKQRYKPSLSWGASFCVQKLLLTDAEIPVEVPKMQISLVRRWMAELSTSFMGQLCFWTENILDVFKNKTKNPSQQGVQTLLSQ